MQKLLYIFFLLLLSGTTQAATALSKSADASAAKPPQHRFKERKGTMGFVYSFVLGPVGYFGVRLFSHNDQMRHQAGRGFKAWGVLVASCAILLAFAALRGSVVPGDLFTSLWSAF